MADPRIKALRIKSGVVKRLAKEKLMYVKEAEQQKQKVEKLKVEGGEEHYVKKQEEVLQESLMMIPDCQRRLSKAVEELEILLEGESSLSETEDYTTAKTVLEEAKTQLSVSETSS